MEDLEKLFGGLRAVTTAQLAPPLSTWNPRETMDINLRITADGNWLHQNAPIPRARMVALFASLLRVEENGAHFLITPHLKYPVTVEDAPFLAVEMRRRGHGKNQELIFRTNVDDVVTADRAHPIFIANEKPYVEIRAGLLAKISRPVFLELAELAVSAENDAQVLGVYSCREFFVLGRAD